MDREKMVLVVVGLVLAVALLQAFQLSGLVNGWQAATRAAAASSAAGASPAGASAGQQANQQLQAPPLGVPSQVGGC